MNNFFKSFSNNNISGSEFCDWIGYDEQTTFIRSKENKYIGKVDRSNNLYYPNGIEENDVISLHDGKITCVKKISKIINIKNEIYES